MTKRKRKILNLLIILFIGLELLIAGQCLYIYWNRPLGEALSLPTIIPFLEKTQTEVTLTPSPVPEATASATIEFPERVGTLTFTPSPTLTATITPTATETVEPTPTPVCGGPDYMNILISGVAVEYNMYGLADAVRVVRVDFQQEKITIIALPRDLWVDIPISVSGRTEDFTPGKLNQSYYYGAKSFGYYTGSAEGSGLMAETLDYDFGLHIDHYLAVNLYGFRQIIDGAGGLYVCFPNNVYKKRTDNVTGLEYAKLYLAAGCQTINGEQAEVAVRQRILIGDLGRIQTQTVVLKALVAKVLTPSGLQYLPDAVTNLMDYVLLDLSPAEISQLLCLLGRIDFEEDVVFAAFPNGTFQQSWAYDPVRGVNTSILAVDKEELRRILADFQEGIWP